MSKNDYDPEVGKRQTASNCAMQYCVVHCKDLDELALHFPVVAEIVLKFVNEPAKSDSGVAGSGVDKVTGSDEGFGFDK